MKLTAEDKVRQEEFKAICALTSQVERHRQIDDFRRTCKHTSKSTYHLGGNEYEVVCNICNKIVGD